MKVTKWPHELLYFVSGTDKKKKIVWHKNYAEKLSDENLKTFSSK